MIAGISPDADIDLFLEKDEIEKVGKETIEGVLIKAMRPRRQGMISICLNEARRNENGCGVGIDDKKYWGVQDDFRVEVFLGREMYFLLIEQGVVGIRQRMRDGSKIHIYDRSRLKGIDAVGAENLEFYRDNKERLDERYD